MRILVIDDDAPVRNFLVRALEHGGHEVHALASGRRLPEVLETLELDAVLTDVYMPDMDGFEALAMVRAARPHLPVVVMSGGTAALGNGLSMAIKLGAAAVLEKPVTVTALHEIFRHLTAPSVPGPVRPAA